MLENIAPYYENITDRKDKEAVKELRENRDARNYEKQYPVEKILQFLTDTGYVRREIEVRYIIADDSNK